MKPKLIFLSFIFQFIALSALAYDAEIDGIYYNLNPTDQTAQVTFFENNKPVYSGDMILPESVPYDGVTYKVTSIGKQAFDNCSELRSMVIPNSVTSIEEFAFFNCNLRCLTIGSGVKEINYRAFVCQITKVIWLTNTPPSGYNNVKGLVHYVPNEQFTAFNNKKVYSLLSSLFEVDGMKYIPVSLSERTCDVIDCIDDELHNEVNINPIVSYKGIDMKVLCVQPYTFYQNSNLQKISIDVAGGIGQHMFDGCKDLRSAILGKDVTAIEEYAFNDCSNLESIVVPDSVKEIGQYAFSDCPTMTSAIIGIGTQTIGQYAFSNCRGLTSVSIGNGTRDIGQYAFSGCSGLTSIIIGNSTKTIRQYAFQNCSSLPVITIPSSLYSIRDYAFSGCISLKEIDLVDRYEDKATITYDDLSVSKSSSINSSTTFEVSEGDVLSFHYSLSNVALHVNFGNEVIKYSKNSGDFSYYFDKSGTVRIWLEAFWQNSSYGGNVTNIKVENDGILVLGSNGNDPLFASCPLDSVYIGRNITYSKSPFYANKSLRSVEISDRDKAISANEFYGCTNLQNVEIGNGVKSIGDWAFSGCSALDVFAFGTSVESIGKEAFSDCNSLTQIIGRAVTPPTCGAQALDDINKWTCKLIVQKGYKSAYEAADQWKDFLFIEEGDLLPIPVTALSMNKPSTSITVGERETLSVTYSPENATERKIKWISSDESVAVVDNNGVVTAIKVGTAIITAKSVTSPDVTATCEITVLPPNIIFADANVKEICVANWDTNGDGELNEAEAAAVTRIWPFMFYAKDIISFDELKYFTNLTEIGDGSFRECAGLTNIVLPGNLISIGDEAFASCSSLSSIVIPNGVTSIGKSAFYECRKLTAANIPEKVTTIENYTFYNCSELASINIPEGVTSIGQYAFYNCSGLTSINIPEGVTSIDYAFPGCSSLTSIDIPKGVTSMNGAFSRCSSLTSIDIPEGVTTIGMNTFSGCTGLTSIVIPEGVTSVHGYAFDGCTNLTSMTLPASLKAFETYLYHPDGTHDGLWKCNKLEAVHIKDLSAWCRIEFGENPLTYAHHLFLNGKEITELIIPDDVTSISAGAFIGCLGISSIVIPNSVTSIGNAAFSGCTNLTSIDISNSVTNIGNGVFSRCTGLTSIVIPNSVTNIGSSAFFGCSGLTSIDLPNSVISIGVGAFYNCKSLSSIIIPGSVTTINQGTFEGCSNLTSVDIANGVISIGANAFKDCCSLTSVNIPNTLNSIGDEAFYGCVNLTSITIPNSVFSIGLRAFDKTLWFQNQQDGLVYAGKVAYVWKGEMPENTVVELIDDTKGIASSAFSGCKGLTSITIPENVTYIGYYCINNCDNLITIICLNPIPPIIDYNLSYSYTATLYVPYGSKEAYQNAEVWNNFANIEELDAPTGICYSEDYTEDSRTIYDLTGRRLNAPQKGFNIIGGKKVVVR